MGNDMHSIFISQILQFYLMGIKSFLKGLVLKMDILSAQAMLRVNENTAFETYVGGIISIIVLIAFSIIFYSSFLSVIGKLQVTYTQAFEDNPTSETSITSMVIAIGVAGIDFSAPGLRKLKVGLAQIKVSPSGSTVSPIQLSICNISDWAPLGQNFDKQFNGFKFNQMLCITKSESFSLYGYSGTLPYQFMRLQIGLCDGAAPCDTAVNAMNWLNTQLLSADFINVRLYVVNTIVSPSKQIFISHIIEKNIIVTFSKTTATIGYAYLGDFTVETDTSIYPYTDYSTQTGTFLDTFTTTTVPVSNAATSKLVQFDFFKSTKSLTVSRNYGKLDSFLSYVGGLFSLLFTVIAFFFSSYNQYCYQLHVGQQCFSIDKSGKKYKQSQFNFAYYLRYCFYDWLNGFGIQPNWQRDIKTKQILNEANCVMSIPLILKRIQHLENVSEILLEEHKILGLHLAVPPTIQESQKIRQKYAFYDQLLNRLQQKRQNEQGNATKIHTQNNIRQLTNMNQTSFNNPSYGLSKEELIFNEQNEIDKKFMAGLRELKNRDDTTSNLIKQKILLYILQRLGDENDKFERLSAKRSSLENTIVKLDIQNL